MPRNNRLFQGLRGRKILESLEINSVTNLRHPAASEYQDVFGANHQHVPAGQGKASSDDCPPSLGGQLQEVVIPNAPGPSNLISTVRESNLFDMSDLESTVSMSSVLMTSHHDFDIDISPLPDYSDVETIEIRHSKSVGHTSSLPDVRPYSFVRSLSLSALTHDDSTTFRSMRKVRSASLLTSNDYLTLSTRDSPTILLSFPGTLSDDEYHPPPSIDRDSSTESEQETEFGDMSEGRKRRHVAEPCHWKRNQAKLRRMKGEDFLGYSRPAGGKFQHDKLRSARQLGDRCKSEFCRRSKLRDCDKITEECRKEVHAYFWKYLNWDQRKIYVNSLVRRSNTARKTTKENSSRRSDSVIYYLPLKSDESEKVQVCKTMFLNTLSLGTFTVYSWTKSGEFGMTPNQDLKNSLCRPPSNPGHDAKMLVLDTFFDNLPKLPSHYARKETAKLFLEPMYQSLADLFKSYKKYCTENEQPQVSRFSFENNFYKKNLSLYTLKKDMCDVCCRYKAGNLNEVDYQIHRIKNDRARQEKADDKKKAAAGEFQLLTMDLEAVKVCPSLTASSLYFKTKLVVHNFTVFNLINKHCTCYWFDETAADLTSNTFVSFIIDYLERYCIIQQLPIIIYSDGCTYQNRNAVMANALLNFSKKYNVTITQKFLEPGHTQMECDSVHSAIERQLKNKEIHLPSDYVTLSKDARKSSPYETVQIDHTFVKDYAATENLIYKSIRPGRRTGDPQVVDIRAIKYDRMTIEIKLNFDENWRQLPQRPKIIHSEIVYNQLRSRKIPIKAIKFNHLQAIKAVLPSDCHPYYDSLPYE